MTREEIQEAYMRQQRLDNAYMALEEAVKRLENEGVKIEVLIDMEALGR